MYYFYWRSLDDTTPTAIKGKRLKKLPVT